MPIETTTDANGRTHPKLRGQFIERYGASCPDCATAGHTTNGGYTPRLNAMPDEPEKPFCVTHGYIDPARTAKDGQTNAAGGAW
jgi:hypothetical protein